MAWQGKHPWLRRLGRRCAPLALVVLGWALWRPAGGPVAVIRVPGVASEAAFLPGGRFLAVESLTWPARQPGAADSWLSLYRVADGRRMWRVPAAFDYREWSVAPDGRYIAYLADATHVAVLSGDTGRRVLSVSPHPGEEFDGDPDISPGGLLAVDAYAGPLRRGWARFHVCLYDVGTGRSAGRLAAPAKGIAFAQVRFSTDGAYVAAAGHFAQDPEACWLSVWRVSDGTRVAFSNDPSALGGMAEMSPFHRARDGTFVCGTTKADLGSPLRARASLGDLPRWREFVGWLDAPGGLALFKASPIDPPERLEVCDINRGRVAAYLSPPGRAHRFRGTPWPDATVLAYSGSGHILALRSEHGVEIRRVELGDYGLVR